MNAKTMRSNGMAGLLLGAAMIGAMWTLVAFAASAYADPAPPTAPEGVVNLNTATPEQLQLLPGIGEARARAIVELRRRRPFARVEDVVGVRGIGRVGLRQLRPYLAVRGDTTLTRSVRGATPPAGTLRGPAAPSKVRPLPARR